MVDVKKFYECLKIKGSNLFCGVPDSLLKDLCAFITDNSENKNNIITANEGNAVAIVAGNYLSTKQIGVVYMQNSGIGNAINPILSLTDEDVYKIPFLMIIGWRGEPGVHDEPQHVKQGKVTIPLLDTMGIKYLILNEDFSSQIDECYKYMKEEGKPVALIVRKNTFSPYKKRKNENNFEISREEALKAIISSIDSKDFIVSTTGKTSREIFEIRENNKEDHGHDFLTVGSMGHASSIALGMSLNTKNKVYCVDGDGAFIMHMGGNAIVANNAGKNFKYILINNGSHESVGGQPTLGYKIEIENILKSFGYKKIYKAFNDKEIKEALRRMNDDLSALIIYTNEESRENLGRPTTTPIENKNAIMEQLSL